MSEMEEKDYVVKQACKDCWMSGANVDGKCTGPDLCIKYKDWQKGAELWYSKTKWHSVEDGDLPKDEDFKLCISARGVYYIAKYEELIGSWTNQEGKEVCLPNAWKEIVLPEE